MPRRYLDPPHLERIDDGFGIGLDRAQLVERFPVLRLAACRFVELAHQAKGAGFGLAGHGDAKDDPQMDDERRRWWASDSEVSPWVAAFLLAFGAFGLFVIAYCAFELAGWALGLTP